MISISDYPHHYKIHSDDPTHPLLYAERKSENSNFVIASNPNKFELHGKYYISQIQANFWGTGFDLLNYGIDYENIPSLKPEISFIPEGIFAKFEKAGEIKYETNIMAE